MDMFATLLVLSFLATTCEPGMTPIKCKYPLLPCKWTWKEQGYWNTGKWEWKCDVDKELHYHEDPIRGKYYAYSKNKMAFKAGLSRCLYYNGSATSAYSIQLQRGPKGRATFTQQSELPSSMQVQWGLKGRATFTQRSELPSSIPLQRGELPSSVQLQRGPKDWATYIYSAKRAPEDSRG